MVRHASLFSQLFALFHRGHFFNLVFRHQAERYAKGFGSWDHFVAMLFCQLAQAKNLREICGGLSCCLGKLRHLGVKKAPTNPHCPMPMPIAPGNGKKHDVTIARKIALSPYSIVAMDRGYNDYRLYAYWIENRIYFVTRLKSNADYTVLEERLSEPARTRCISRFGQH